jgi:hypothetical protein
MGDMHTHPKRGLLEIADGWQLKFLVVHKTSELKVI